MSVEREVPPSGAYPWPVQATSPSVKEAQQHIKTNHLCWTEDGWRLHLVRTLQLGGTVRRTHPVMLVPGLGSSGSFTFTNIIVSIDINRHIMVPGLGSSGSYTFDLSPSISFVDYLASEGWDVWTVELRGNGASDKPQPFRRSSWWTVDDNVTKDLPALIRYVCQQTRSVQLHMLAHSMGGMMVCGLFALQHYTSFRLRSATIVGSGCYLEKSGWRAFDVLSPASRLFYTIPLGLVTRLLSRVALGPWGIPSLDLLYFWPSNTDPRLARALLARNFSSLSPGIILHMRNAFGGDGLRTYDGSKRYADPKLLADVTTPVMFLVGDKDKMCPPEGCRKTWQAFGCKDKRFVCMGPENGNADHYGHFDILMGKRAEREVFPQLHQWLETHDGPAHSRL